MSARGNTGRRCGLEMVERGLYRADGGLLVRQLGGQRWVVTFHGDSEPVWVRGLKEFGSLTEAAGLLADQRDLQRRAA